ncbi:MAG TPA: TetR/AcrR family transcriptional regulator [Frankiaceae bacterium]|nr:TetR/AcrR family transcriptional regulator [Frankiaceae bacterium]
MPSTPRGQRTRSLIIDRTAAVFDQQGFAGATLTQLVAATGLTRGAFYFHFDSKDALAEAIVQRQQERWLPIVDELKAAEPDPLRRLLRLTFRHGTLFQGDLVMRAGSRLMTERSLIRRELWRSYPWWIDATRSLLAEAADELPDTSALASAGWPAPEQVPPGVPRGLAALAEHLVGMWAGVLQQSTAAGQDDLPDRVRASWIATLPLLCSSPERRQELTALVEELSTQMREAGRQRADSGLEPKIDPLADIEDVHKGLADDEYEDEDEELAG